VIEETEAALEEMEREFLIVLKNTADRKNIALFGWRENAIKPREY